MTPPADQSERLAAGLERIAELLRLEQNWDSYGAERVSYEAAVLAARFLASLLHLPPPQIVPRPGGSIDLEWNTGGVEDFGVMVHVAENGAACLADLPPDDEPHQVAVEVGDPRIDEWLRRLYAD